MERPVVALMTDFGEDDFFVASLKGVILKISHLTRIIDITHNLPSFDIKSACFILFASYRYFPPGTIFLVVVDPGVGSSRKVLLAEAKDYFFIAPDNGILTLVLAEEDIKQLRVVANPEYFLPDISHTFEGRDKMAPVAAWLSKGVACHEFGPEVKSYQKLKMEKPKIKGSEIVGSVLYKDKFGNLITNIPAEMMDTILQRAGKTNFRLSIKGRTISNFLKSYSSVKKGEFLFLKGSVGLIEVAAREESAANKLKAGVGDEVRIVLSSKR